MELQRVVYMPVLYVYMPVLLVNIYYILNTSIMVYGSSYYFAKLQCTYVNLMKMNDQLHCFYNRSWGCITSCPQRNRLHGIWDISHVTKIISMKPYLSLLVNIRSFLTVIDIRASQGITGEAMLSLHTWHMHYHNKPGRHWDCYGIKLCLFVFNIAYYAVAL